MGLLSRTNRDDVDVVSVLSNLDRLNALEDARITNHLRPKLDRLAQTAARWLNTPQAYMTVLDDKHIYLAGMTGVTGELAETRTQAAEASYCQYVVATNDVLVVDDSTETGLVRDHPATIDGVRAYLGVPVRYGGHCLGSFCVVDTKARDWTDEDLGILQDLANQAMSELG